MTEPDNKKTKTNFYPFKTKPETEIIDILLKGNFMKEDNFYVINNNGFKVFLENKKHIDLFDILKNYYLQSAYKYINIKNDEWTFPKFITIIRQLCRILNLDFKRELRYFESQYDFHYFVYLT